MGDNLDDDFQVDDLIVQDEGPATDIVSVNNKEDSYVGESLSESETDSKSRKETSKSSKRQKKKRKLNKDQNDEDQDDEAIPLSIFPPWVLIDKFTEKQNSALKGLSRLEADEIKVSEKNILDTSEWKTKSPEDRWSITKLVSHVTRLKNPSKQNGTPTILVVSGAALRVADLCREIRPILPQGTKPAKLFAKHVKINEQIETLTSTKTPVAIGTPGRLSQLLKHPDNPLNLDQLKYIILDVSYLNSKKYSLWDMNEARHDLFANVLGDPKIMQRLRSAETSLVFF